MAAGGKVETTVVDALDERAVDGFVQSVVTTAGSVDISFALILRGEVQGIPLVEMTPDDFMRPVERGVRAQFITAKAAARRMIQQGSGVILALDSGSARVSPMMGGTGPADAATDSFVRNLATEIGPHGVRVLGIWAAGIPETLSPEKIGAVNGNLPLDDDAFQGLLAHLDEMRLVRRSPRLDQFAATAAFLASDRSAVTGTFLNVSGMFVS